MRPGFKKALLYAITCAVPCVALLLAVSSYYAYRKLTENVVYSETFGKLDDELGWILRPHAESRVFLKNRATGETYYDVWIHTNEDGFRSAAPQDMSPANAVLAIGDSWTFGTAVNYPDSYPAQLAARLGIGVANMGVPAHGLAQTVLLLERHLKRLKPRAVVHVNLGLWIRSICHGTTRPQAILKPCYWRNPDTGQILLVTPPPGHVERMATAGVYPGGWLTAGHNSWAYYLVSRPVARASQLLAQIGVLSGPVSDDDTQTSDRDAVLEHALQHFLDLAWRNDFTFVLFDPRGDYTSVASDVGNGRRARLIYVGPDEIAREMEPMITQLPEERRRVRGDGHYTGEYMAAWADALARRLMPILSRPN